MLSLIDYVSVDWPAHYRSLYTHWELLQETWIFFGNFLYCSCPQWLYDHRLLTSARSVVSEQFFIDGLPTHNTGRQHQANFPPQGEGKLCFKFTSKRAQILICKFDGHIVPQFKLCCFVWSRYKYAFNILMRYLCNLLFEISTTKLWTQKF